MTKTMPLSSCADNVIELNGLNDRVNNNATLTINRSGEEKPFSRSKICSTMFIKLLSVTQMVRKIIKYL